MQESGAASVEDAELLLRIHQQIAYYFTPENLARDTYLRSQLDSEGYAPLKLIGGFKKVKDLTLDLQVIMRALKGSRYVELDESNSRIKGRKQGRNTIILREIPSDESIRPEVEAIFGSGGEEAPTFTELRCDVGDTWFVSFEDEETALYALNWLRGREFRGEPVKARMKSQTQQRSFYVPPAQVVMPAGQPGYYAGGAPAPVYGAGGYQYWNAYPQTYGGYTPSPQQAPAAAQAQQQAPPQQQQSAAAAQPVVTVQPAAAKPSKAAAAAAAATTQPATRAASKTKPQLALSAFPPLPGAIDAASDSKRVAPTHTLAYARKVVGEVVAKKPAMPSEFSALVSSGHRMATVFREEPLAQLAPLPQAPPREQSPPRRVSQQKRRVSSNSKTRPIVKASGSAKTAATAAATKKTEAKKAPAPKAKPAPAKPQVRSWAQAVGSKAKSSAPKSPQK